MKKKRYQINIIRETSHWVTVDAEDEEQAKELAHDLVHDGHSDSFTVLFQGVEDIEEQYWA